MRKRTKIISVLLALMLTVGLVQTAFIQAFAQEEEEKEIIGIEISQTPDITAYKESTYFDDDSIDLSGLQINVKYSDNSGCVYSFDEPNWSSYNYSFGCRFENEQGEGEIFYVGLVGDDEAYESYYLIQPGENKVFVRLDSGDYDETPDDYYAYFTVTGYEPEVEKIEITSLPSKTEFEEGEYIDFSGLCYNVYFSDGSTQYFDGYEGDANYFTRSKYNDDGRLVVGENTVKIFYGDCEDVYDTFAITVRESAREKDESIESIKVTKLPDKLTYVRDYEYPELLGSQVTVYYKDGSTVILTPEFDEVPFTSPEYAGDYLFAYDKQGNGYLGKGNITVEYGGHTDEFEVDWIENPVAGAELVKMPDILTDGNFEIPKDVEEWYSATTSIEQNMRGAQLAVTYKDGTKATYTFEEPLTLEPGKYTPYYINGFYANVDVVPFEDDDWSIWIDYLGEGGMFEVGVAGVSGERPLPSESNEGKDTKSSEDKGSDENKNSSDGSAKENTATLGGATNDSVNNGGNDNGTVQTGSAGHSVIALLILLFAGSLMLVIYRKKYFR